MPANKGMSVGSTVAEPLLTWPPGYHIGRYVVSLNLCPISAQRGKRAEDIFLGERGCPTLESRHTKAGDAEESRRLRQKEKAYRALVKLYSARVYCSDLLSISRENPPKVREDPPRLGPLPAPAPSSVFRTRGHSARLQAQLALQETRGRGFSTGLRCSSLDASEIID